MATWKVCTSCGKPIKISSSKMQLESKPQQALKDLLAYCPRCEKEVVIKVKRHIGGSYSKYEVCSICGKKLKESPWHSFETFCWVIICIVTIIGAVFIGIISVI